MLFATFICAILAMIPLVLIFSDLLIRGGGALNFDFFTQLPKPVGETGGGMANAIAGTLMLILTASAMGVPVGVMGGIYLAEFGKGRFSSWVRFSADVLSGTPSIVIGIFAYTLFVLPMKGFSGVSGSFALAIIMIPIILRTTEEMMRLVPVSLREGALALGIHRWKMLTFVVLKTAASGIITAIMLAVARIAGETAPLLFTTLGNQYWNFSPLEPTAALPLQIYTFSISPYEDWQRQALAGAFVLIVIIFLLNALSRLIFHENKN